ncbi:hypothetical protein ACFTZJ_32080, partial [Streptomyces globisporus]|uniref:hypothetical protein n=1 Tax=Streptomyces globisporus TaxID=1908 RepID=UPI003644C15F
PLGSFSRSGGDPWGTAGRGSGAIPAPPAPPPAGAPLPQSTLDAVRELYDRSIRAEVHDRW